MNKDRANFDKLQKEQAEDAKRLEKALAERARVEKMLKEEQRPSCLRTSIKWAWTCCCCCFYERRRCSQNPSAVLSWQFYSNTLPPKKPCCTYGHTACTPRIFLQKYLTWETAKAWALTHFFLHWRSWTGWPPPMPNTVALSSPWFTWQARSPKGWHVWQGKGHCHRDWTRSMHEYLTCRRLVKMFGQTLINSRKVDQLIIDTFEVDAACNQ